MGEVERARESRNWILISLITVVGCSLGAVFFPSSLSSFLSRFSGLILLLTWYFVSGRRQARYVKERFGQDYPRRGWLQPLLVALGLFVGFIVLIGVLAFVLALSANFFDGSELPS